MTGDPLLAPLGNYGGPTLTMPPLPLSPARAFPGLFSSDIFVPHNDQRGLPRNGLPFSFLGAVEVQETEFIEPFLPFSVTYFGKDNDGDGYPNGIELFLGTDFENADLSDPRLLSLSTNQGLLNLSFGTNENLSFGNENTPLPVGSTLRVMRSTTGLNVDDFTEVARFTVTEADRFSTEGTFNTFDSNTINFGFTTINNELFFDFNDAEVNNFTRAFYRLEAEIEFIPFTPEF